MSFRQMDILIETTIIVVPFVKGIFTIMVERGS